MTFFTRKCNRNYQLQWKPTPKWNVHFHLLGRKSSFWILVSDCVLGNRMHSKKLKKKICWVLQNINKQVSEFSFIKIQWKLSHHLWRDQWSAIYKGSNLYNRNYLNFFFSYCSFVRFCLQLPLFSKSLLSFLNSIFFVVVVCWMSFFSHFLWIEINMRFLKSEWICTVYSNFSVVFVIVYRLKYQQINGMKQGIRKHCIFFHFLTTTYTHKRIYA